MPLSPHEPAVVVTRGGVVESTHLAHVVVCPPQGDPVVIAGRADAVVYPRSALKPVQTLAVMAVLAEHGLTMTTEQRAIASASHAGEDDHQVEAAALLAEAGLDESALQCPPSWPIDDRVVAQLDEKTSLSHNCSGKHAAMLWAHTVAGDDPATYLDTDSPLQRRIADQLERMLGEAPAGPGVDGCGAPAWRCSLAGLGRAFARLVQGTDADVAAVRDAFTAHPELIGGRELPDTAMMWSDSRIVAKRGADGVMAAGFTHPQHGPLGVAVKVLDGGDRAAGPLSAAVLHALGASIPPAGLQTPVLGGGRQQGTIHAVGEIASTTTEAFGLA